MKLMLWPIHRQREVQQPTRLVQSQSPEHACPHGEKRVPKGEAMMHYTHIEQLMITKFIRFRS